MDQSKPYRTISVNNPRVETLSLILKKLGNPRQVTILIQEMSTDIADIRLHVTTLTVHNIERVSEYKYLGIRLDQKLTCVSKLRQEIGY